VQCTVCVRARMSCAVQCEQWISGVWRIMIAMVVGCSWSDVTCRVWRAWRVQCMVGTVQRVRSASSPCAQDVVCVAG
jgi:hypothetical protein